MSYQGEAGMSIGSEIQYEVPGHDIIAKLTDRAAAATQVAKDLLGPDGSKPDSPCESGMYEQATDDAERLLLRAKYLTAERIYTVSANTLADLFFEQKRYQGLAQTLGAMPAEAMERQW